MQCDHLTVIHDHKYNQKQIIFTNIKNTNHFKH